MAVELLLSDKSLNITELVIPDFRKKGYELNINRDFPELDEQVTKMMENYSNDFDMNIWHTTIFMENALYAKILNPGNYSDLISQEVRKQIDSIENVFAPENVSIDEFDHLTDSLENEVADFYFLKRLLGYDEITKKQKNIMSDYSLEHYLKSGFDPIQQYQAENLAKYKILYPENFNKLNSEDINQILINSIEGWRDEGIDSDEFLSEVTYSFLINPKLVKDILSIEELEYIKKLAIEEKSLKRFGQLAIISSERAEIIENKGLVLIPQKNINLSEILPIPTMRSF